MDLEAHLCAVTGATRARRGERLQALWSGWGEIVRFYLDDAPVPSVVVKRVQPPDPRGGGGGRSGARKRRSYAIEGTFYREHGRRCGAAVRIPEIWSIHEGLFVLEDLDAAGFTGRAVGAGSLRAHHLTACLRWLAGFHAASLGAAPDGLWPEGTYWHLETRPDEHAAMAPGPLRDAAGAIDAALASARFRTWVHGDAKIANFCLAPDAVAAVDFQYVGGGCGVKDLAYFLGSCLGDAALQRDAARWTDAYFAALRAALPPGTDGSALEAEWRGLLPLAWADFERFLAGWAPGHWKRSGYAAQQTQTALASL